MRDAPITCQGCGAQVPDMPETRVRAAYVGSAPGCWQLYTDLLAREYSDIRYAPAHQLTVDTYMVQHPGEPARRSAQSVAIHLVGLCLMLERGRTPAELPGLRKRVVERHEIFPWLTPAPEPWRADHPGHPRRCLRGGPSGSRRPLGRIGLGGLVGAS